MRSPPPSAWFWGCLLCLAALTGLRYDLRASRADGPVGSAKETSPAPLHGQYAPATASDRGAAFQPLGPTLSELEEPARDPASRTIADTLGADDSIYLSLKRRGVSEGMVLQLIQALRPVYDPRTRSRPGDRYALELGEADSVIQFQYVPRASPESPVLVSPSPSGLKGEQVTLPLEERTRIVRLRIEDNLANAVAASGETVALTDLLADVIFGAVVDFHREPRRGDRIDLVLTKLYLGDTFVRYARVDMARYRGQIIDRTAVYYPVDTAGAYYDETGASLERLFLLKPLSYRRISGRFTYKRFHPILKKNRPHLGTDYAAAPGTEVMATARGRVTMAGWNGGYGKMVEVEHPNGYRTRYAHLSRILVRVGQRVEKRQIIGRVGSTGLATGPHLHYELLHNGHHINPSVVNRGAVGTPLSESELRTFARRRDALYDLIDDRAEPQQVAAGKQSDGG